MTEKPIVAEFNLLFHIYHLWVLLDGFKKIRQVACIGTQKFKFITAYGRDFLSVHLHSNKHKLNTNLPF